MEGFLPLAITFDFLTAWDFWIGVGILAGIYGIFTLGLQLNVGYTGIVNFGQAGFMAIGAYVSIICVVDFELPFLLSLLIAMVAAMLASLIIGLPSLRLRADYFAIATIAFSEIIRDIAQNARDITGGNQGTISIELDSDSGIFFTDSWLNASDWIIANILDPIGLGGPDLQLVTPLPGRLDHARRARVRALAPDPLALGSRAARGSRGRGRRASARQERVRVHAPVARDRVGAGRALGVVRRDPGGVGRQDASSRCHVRRLRDPDPRRPREHRGDGRAVFLQVLLEGIRFVDMRLSGDKEASLRFMFVGLVLIR